MLHVHVAVLPTQGQYQSIPRMENKMNNLENIVNDEIQVLQFLVLDVEKGLNQILKQNEPNETL